MLSTETQQLIKILDNMLAKLELNKVLFAVEIKERLINNLNVVNNLFTVTEQSKHNEH